MTVPSYQDTARELSRYTRLSPDFFSSIEDWRHYAILELMKVDGFENDVSWIANALGISKDSAKQYIERLQTVGLLEVLPDGSWRDVSEGCTFMDPSDSEVTAAQQRLQKTLLAFGIQAIDEISPEERDNASIMMATDRSRIAGAKKMITKFLIDLCGYLEGGKKKEAVYQVSLAMFPLVKTESEKHG